MPKREFYGLNYTEQVNNQTNDIVNHELGRFVALLMNNNPNILELLATSEQFVLHKTPVISLLKSEMFLSKLCCKTFAGYAKSQIHKAKGLNKKIVLQKRGKTCLHRNFAASNLPDTPDKTSVNELLVEMLEGLYNEKLFEN